MTWKQRYITIGIGSKIRFIKLRADADLEDDEDYKDLKVGDTFVVTSVEDSGYNGKKYKYQMYGLKDTDM